MSRRLLPASRSSADTLPTCLLLPDAALPVKHAGKLNALPCLCRHKFFNTNNLWVNLCKLKATLDGSGAPIPPPLLLSLAWLPHHAGPPLPPAMPVHLSNCPLPCPALCCPALRCSRCAGAAPDQEQEDGQPPRFLLASCLPAGPCRCLPAFLPACPLCPPAPALLVSHTSLPPACSTIHLPWPGLAWPAPPNPAQP